MAESEQKAPDNTVGIELNFERKLAGLEYLNLFKESGRVNRIVGPIIEGTLPGGMVGGVCVIKQKNLAPVEAEIVGFKDRTVILMPVQDTAGIRMGARIEQLDRSVSVEIGPWMIGKLLDGMGKELPKGVDVPNPIQIEARNEKRPLKVEALTPGERRSITDRLELGVRSLDFTVPVGKGQRLAIMAASGVGKSVLMGMAARQSKADINVIALIGERGREVTEFIERDLGPEGLKNTIVVCVTSDQSPVLKVRGAYLATTIAEYFRDLGLDVLLMVDSVTRFGMALREIGLSSGEPPTTKGYTPSVFSHMPKLLERAGARKAGGSITGLYTVLVEGNDFDDPIADSVRSIVDGHIVLSRKLAHKNHYPAVDVLESVSRLNHVISNPQEKELNTKVRQVLATYRDAEDLINIGGYRKGNNPEWDRAIELYPKIIEFLKQDIEEYDNFSEARSRLEGALRGKV